MKILDYYINKQSNLAWLTEYQSTSGSKSGKSFPYINTNFRSIMSFFSQLKMFESKDGVPRDRWYDYQQGGQEKDKHRVINLTNAGFIVRQNGIYNITNKGKTLLALNKEQNITDNEKWPLLLLLLLDYSSDTRCFDIIYVVMNIYTVLNDLGVEAVQLLKYLKIGIKADSKESLFSSDIFWLVSFYKDKEFIKIYLEASEDEKRDLHDYVKSQSHNKLSKDCIAHKFVASGAYAYGTFVDDLKVILSVLIMLMLQDRDPLNYLKVYCALERNCKSNDIILFYEQNQSEFMSVYDKTINKINKDIGVDFMEIEDRLQEVQSALGLKEGVVTDQIEYAWYVGATGNDDNGVYTDFSDKYIDEGRWENRYDSKYYDQVNSIKVGDKIVIKSAYTKKRGLPFDNHGRTVGVMGIKAIGTVTKNYFDGKHLDVSWQRVQPIKEWFGDGVLRTTVHLVKASDSYIKKALLMFTFYDMPQDYSLMDVSGDDKDDERVEEEDTSEYDLLPVRTHKDSDDNPLNVILYGAPGTGKTYLTVEYAVAICENRKAEDKAVPTSERAEIKRRYDALVNEGRIVFTTFHQSYGYEDFIQGLRPKTDESNMKFSTVDGVFKQIADRAMKDDVNNYVIIIDEINRGNISKIFGELITLIEPDKRWGEDNQMSVTLPSGDRFAVPNNLYIIGTMNSADKSISLIDTALRRRFAFIEKAPDYDIISDTVMRDVLEKLNQYIRSELRSTDLLIGHAFFIGKEQSDLVSIMNGQIIPLLYEYFYDDEVRVKKALQCLEGTGVAIDTKYLGRIRVK